MSSAERIEELRLLIARYRDAYYNKDQSLVSDQEYDQLERELAKLEKSTQSMPRIHRLPK